MSTDRRPAARLAMDAKKETRRLLKWLGFLVWTSARTQRDIERRAGWSRGYLSRVLGGRVDLKLRHLLTVLDAIGTDPAGFFFQLFPRRRDRVAQILAGPRLGARRLEQPLVFELARLYGYGVECLEDLDQRLERCEDALLELAGSESIEPRA